MPSRPIKKTATKKAAKRPAPKQLTHKGKKYTLNLKPGTELRLAQAGYSFPGSFDDAATALLASTELARICSGTDLTIEEFADTLTSYDPIVEAVMQTMDDIEAQAVAKSKKVAKGDEAGNG